MGSGWALQVPPLKGRINDYAGLLEEGQKAQLEYVLARYEEETSNQIAVLIVPSLEGEDIEAFSMMVAEAWKIGHKGKDNGVIIVIALRDRRIRIEVGYGLEGVLTDVEASRIIRTVFVPAFRRGDYFGGIASGIHAVIQATKGEFRGVQGQKGDPYWAEALLLLFLFLIVLFSRFGRFMLVGGMMDTMFGGRMGRGGLGGGFSGFRGGGGGFGGGGASGRW